MYEHLIALRFQSGRLLVLIVRRLLLLLLLPLRRKQQPRPQRLQNNSVSTQSATTCRGQTAKEMAASNTSSSFGANVGIADHFMDQDGKKANCLRTMPTRRALTLGKLAVHAAGVLQHQTLTKHAETTKIAVLPTSACAQTLRQQLKQRSCAQYCAVCARCRRRQQQCQPLSQQQQLQCR